MTTDVPDTGAARRRAAQLDALFAANVLGVVAGEGDLFTEANDEFLRVIGRTRAELETGLAWPAITPVDQVERDTAAVEAIRRDGGSLVLKDFLRPDGVRVPVLAAVAATGWDPYRWIAVVVDLSHDERLRQLAESEAAIVSTLLEDAPIGFALIDPQLRFVRVNREMAAMNGCSPAEHEGRAVFDVVPGVRESAQPLLERVLATGEPLRDVEVVGTTAADPGVQHTWMESFFPVRMPHGPVVGLAAIARDETEIRGLQRELHATLARQRDALVQLQEGLLPETLPAVRGLDLAATYQSATDLISLGGDWYDVVRAPDGRLVVSLGDAVGHGVAAVGVMARASGAIRAYVCEGHRPAQILTCLNTLLCSPDFPGLATAVIVSIDPADGHVEYAAAGHPYPLLRTSPGAVRALDASQGPLLGATPAPRYSAGTTALPPGSALLLYTDGLIERRDEPISAGQQRLATALSGSPASARSDELVRAALHACLSGRDRADDVCLLAVTRPAATGGPGEEAS